jgi:hypothetical protein
MEAYEDTSIPAAVREPLHVYFLSIPGFVREKGARQSTAVLDRHGFVVMQVAKMLGTFVDTYSPWCGTSVHHDDLSMKDVVNGRRILHVVVDERDADPDLVPTLVRSALEMALAGHHYRSPPEPNRPFVVFHARATESQQTDWLQMTRIHEGQVGYVSSCRVDGMPTASSPLSATVGAIVVMDDGVKGNPRVAGGVVVPSGGRTGHAVVVMNGSSTSIMCNYRGISGRDYQKLDVVPSDFISTPKEMLA